MSNELQISAEKQMLKNGCFNYVNDYISINAIVIHREVSEILETTNVKDKHLHVTRLLNKHSKSLTIFNDSIETQEMYENDLVYAFGLGTSTKLTGLLIFSVMFSEYENSKSCKDFLEHFESEIWGSGIINLDLASLIKYYKNFKSLFTKFIKDLKSIFQKEISNEETILRIEKLLLKLYNKYDDLKNKMKIANSNYLCECKYNNKKYKSFVHSGNKEYIRIRIRIPEDKQDDMLFGNYQKVKMILVNNKNGKLDFDYIINGYARKANDEDYEGMRDFYLVLKYSDINDFLTLRSRSLKSFDFKLFIVVADDVAKDFGAVYKHIDKEKTFKYLQDEDKIVAETFLELNLSKILIFKES